MKSGKAFVSISTALGAVALALCCAAPVLAGTQYEITALGAGYADGLNNAGAVVGFSTDYTTALQWAGGSTSALQALATPSFSAGTYYTAAVGISSNGVIAGSVGDAGALNGTDNNSNALIWNSSSSAPTNINPGGYTSNAWAINAAGTTVVGWIQATTAGSPLQAAISTGGGALAPLSVTSNPANLTLAIATGINSSGEIVGYATDSTGNVHSFLYNAGTVTDLGVTGGPANALNGALAINDSGLVVGAVETDQTAPGDEYAYSQTTSPLSGMNSLDTTSDVFSQANAVNNGNAIVGFAGNDSVWNAAIFSSTGPIELSTLVDNLSGWSQLEWATGINDNGQIIGTGTYNGQTEAFLLTPVPEPISMIFFGTGLVAVGGYISRRRMMRKA
jgi:probable HAF family extracellular repeat protein